MTTKKDIVKQIAAKHGLPQFDAKNVVQSFLDTVVDVLVKEGRLELRDFGVFQVKERAERKARNPKTGESVIVPARKVVTFNPGKLLHDKVSSL
jgi:nucleoid DNA-binding protein